MIPSIALKILMILISNIVYFNFFGERLDEKIKEKRSGKRNRNTFATVLFLFRFVTPVPRKLNQAMLFLSLSHLWLSRRYSVDN